MIGTLAQRFWAKVDRRGPDECWPWMGSRRPTGYGKICRGGHSGPLLEATAVALELDGRPKPEGLEALHSCDHPWCVNPRHLSWGSHKENMGEMATRGRSLRGERHHRALLSEAQVLEIRRLRAAGHVQTAVAAAFGVSRSAIKNIDTGHRWSHVKEEKKK